jgi:hypothetical protein
LRDDRVTGLRLIVHPASKHGRSATPAVGAGTGGLRLAPTPMRRGASGSTRPVRRPQPPSSKPIRGTTRPPREPKPAALLRPGSIRRPYSKRFGASTSQTRNRGSGRGGKPRPKQPITSSKSGYGLNGANAA